MRPTTGSAIELANLRTAFRWAADQGDLDVAAAIATLRGLFGLVTENYEPIAWAEELIEPARAVDHPRLATLYVIASLCYMAGRIDDGVRYTRRRPDGSGSGRDEVPSGFEACSALRTRSHRPTRTMGRVVPRPARTRPRHSRTFTRACLVIALTVAGSGEEAMAATNGLIEAAEATGNPFVLSFALFAYGYAFRDADPARSLDAPRRGLAIAQDSGNRFNESHLAIDLVPPRSRARRPAWPRSITSLVAIRNFLDSGNTTMIRTPLAALAAFFDRLGRYEPAATIAGFASAPSPQRPSRDQHRDHPPARGPRRRDLRIARPQG